MAEILLQRTRAAQAARVYAALMEAYPSTRMLATADEARIATILAPVGLTWRIERLTALLREIGRRNGRLPRTAQELMELPGVGTYAASAALSLHGNRHAVIVDSNVVRILSRLVGEPFDGETRRKAWLINLAEKLTPDEHYRVYNYAILDLAMQLCLPRHPLCEDCPIRPWCATGSRDDV